LRLYPRTSRAGTDALYVVARADVPQEVRRRRDMRGYVGGAAADRDCEHRFYSTLQVRDATEQRDDRAICGRAALQPSGVQSRRTKYPSSSKFASISSWKARWTASPMRRVVLSLCPRFDRFILAP
jgi:hypothetical protein